MKLDNRLKTIADFIEQDTIVGDIGSDHGYLITYLVEHHKIKKGIASDINVGPVKNCQETINMNGFQEMIDVRLGGGFLPYKKNEIHTAVLAGMGGELIRDIFLESKKVVASIKRFVLQPMTNQSVLRKWLIENNFNIITEKIANDQDRFYEILVVEHGMCDTKLPNHMKHMTIENPLVMEIGFKTIVDKTYDGFINKKIEKYTTIMNNIHSNGDKTHPKFLLAQSNVEMLKEVKSCIQTQIKL